MPRWVAFLVLSWSAVGALIWAARAAGAWPPWFLLALLVGLSVPIYFFGTWRASLRRAHELRLFRDGGRLRPLLGRPLLRTVVWLAVAPALALAVFVAAAGANRPAAVALLVPPALCLLFLLADRALRADVAAPHRRAMALRTAVFLAPVLLDAGVQQVLRLAAFDLPPDARIRVVASAALDGLALPATAVVVTSSGERTAASAAAGGLVAALVVKKVAAKGTLKLAAKAVAKVAASKAAGTSGGAGAGALAGAAIGSAVPVIGTAAGAVVGGIIGGLAVGVGVDYLMLQLEEAWSRAAFRQQILDAIEAQRAAFLARLAPER